MSEKMSATCFTDLPPETLLHIFTDVEPTALGRLPQVCRKFHRLITGNDWLFKQQYLLHWDDPRELPTKPVMSWARDFQTRIAALKVAGYSDLDAQRNNLNKLAEAVDSLATSACTAGLPWGGFNPQVHRNMHLLEDMFDSEKRPERIERLLSQSALFARACGGPTDSEITPHERRQRRASAKMHCLYGAAIMDGKDGADVYPYAASKIYDLRNYKTENHWGPFLDDGSGEVDWEKLEAVMVVLGHNIQRIDENGQSSIAMLWRQPFFGTMAYSYKGGSKGPFQPSEAGTNAPWCRTKPDPELEAQDPYGVTGTWLRIVCFLDYRNLYEYNFGQDARLVRRGTPRPALNTDEAVRLLVMTLVVTGIHYPQAEDSEQDEDDSMQADVPPDPATSSRSNFKPDHRKMPIVSFTGTARALHPIWDPNANSAIRGTVMTTPEGEIRWTSVSVYHGVEERWKSEGIQVGGVQSAKGVIGNWFDKDYRPEGPAGPTSFWKIRDTVNCAPENERAGAPGFWNPNAGTAIWLEGHD